MESRVKALGHPIHPMIIVFPLGLLSTAVLFDLIQAIDSEGAWSFVGFYLIGAGVVGGLVAAVFGFRDWQHIPAGSRAKRIGLYHGLVNVGVTTLFLLSWLIRMGAQDRRPDTLAFTLSLLGAGVAVVGGWLGGELVYRLRVGVDDNANLDAPSSL